MKFETEVLHCSKYLLKTFENEVNEVKNTISLIKWKSDFGYKNSLHQTAYNKILKIYLGT